MKKIFLLETISSSFNTLINVLSFLLILWLLLFIAFIVFEELKPHICCFHIPLKNYDCKLHFKKIYIFCARISDAKIIGAMACKYNKYFYKFNAAFTREIHEDISSYSKEISNDRDALFSQYQSQLKIIYHDLKDWKRRYKKTKDKSQSANIVNELNDISTIKSLAKAFIRDIKDIEKEYAQFSSDYNTALKSLGDSASIPLFEDVIIPQCDELS